MVAVEEEENSLPKNEDLWVLSKKIDKQREDEKSFVFDVIPKSEEHEKQIPRFEKEIKGEKIEIFKIEGHQFMTSDGVFRILKRVETSEIVTTVSYE